MTDLKKIKYFLLDMDGTIYLDHTLFDGTLDFLKLLRAQGKQAVYLTNNSSRSVDTYVEKLAALGIEAAREDFYTSARALIYRLQQEAPGCRLFLLGTPSLEKDLTASGFTTVKTYTQNPEERPAYVVLAYDTTLTYQKLADACHYITEGIPYWATHPDIVCPYTKDFSLPDAGAFIACIQAATNGRLPSFIAGKPAPYMIQMFLSDRHCSPEEVAVVGDRLYTDIQSAINAGVTSVCVLTGETNREMLAHASIQPDYVFDSIKNLYELLRA